MAEPARFKYINLKTGIEMNVETLEEVSNPFKSPVSFSKEENADSLQTNEEASEDHSNGKIFQIVMEQNDLVFLFYKRKA